MTFFTIDKNGIITTDVENIKRDFETAYRNALGNELNIDTSTPVGQLIMNDTVVLETAMQDFLQVINMNNVRTASTDEDLDFAAAQWGYFRKSSVYSIANIQIIGTNGTEIPAGTLFSNGSDEFQLTTDFIIGGGSSVAQVQAVNPGAVNVASNTINQIVTPINGMDSVNNTDSGVMGSSIESSNDFVKRILNGWLAIRGKSFLQSIIDRVYALDGVLDVLGLENPTNDPMTIKGVPLTPHSIYLCINGGIGNQIADAIAETKSVGCGTNGSTTVASVANSISYQIDRPIFVPFYVQVTFSANNLTLTDSSDRAKGIILDSLSEDRLRIGETISASRFWSVMQEFREISVASIKVSQDNTNWVDFFTINTNQLGTLELNNITMVAL